MKPLSLPLLLVSFFWAVATSVLAGPPTEVLGIRWGTPAADVRRVMSARPGVTFVEEKPDYVLFKGGQFATKDVESWRFEFTNGKFSKAVISFVRSSVRDAKGWLNDQNHGYVHRQLVQKYGKAQELHDGDHRQSVWTFPDALVRGASKTINLSYRWFGKEPHIRLTYADVLPPAARTSGASRVQDEL